MSLFWPDEPADSLTIRGARVIDPAAGVDGAFDVTVDDGVITSLQEAGDPAPGLVLAPAFVDPHVHLRVPGREDEETVATGTAAARRRRVLRDPRDAQHRPGRRLGGRPRRPDRAGSGDGRRPDRLPRCDHKGPPG